MRNILNSLNRLLVTMMGLFLCGASSALAGSPEVTAFASTSTSPFSSLEGGASQWWNGSSGTDKWLGLGNPLSDNGLTVTGSAKETFFGNLTGGLPNEPQGNWSTEIRLQATYDFEKILGLKGLTFESGWRYRATDGSQSTPYVGIQAGTTGASSLFNPNYESSGLGVRILPQYFQWQSDSSKDPRFLVNAGWENPYDQFLQQPLSKMFENTSIQQNHGIGGAAGPGIPVWSASQKKYVTYTTTSVPWSSAYAAWGGTLRAKPSSSTYIQSGLYMAISGYNGVQTSAWTPTQVYPYTSVNSSYLGKLMTGGTSQVSAVNAKGLPNGTTKSPYVVPAQNNHGFNFQGAGTFNPNGNGGLYAQNGLYNVNEVGWTPKLGADKLDGKYAVGSYIWGQNNTSYTPTTWVPASGNVTAQKKPTAFDQNSVIWGMYFQADQRLYANREASAPAPSMGKNPVEAPAYTPSKTRGLYSFNVFSFTPPQNNALPFYFSAGLVYKGLLDARKDDQMGVCFGSGFYSSYFNQYIDSQNQALKTAYNGHNATPANTVPNGPITSRGQSYYAYLPHYSSTQVLESFYNIQINKWASLKPYAQWIVNPAGNGTVGNDLLLGARLMVMF
ncbi:MAG: carbohydrate porin [Verrucomicrobia bacterium]|nr:MAG: carbohydrate porin [Verrucomicrobiota bacterium]